MTEARSFLFASMALLFAALSPFSAPAWAQIVDPRVIALEEQIRTLTGKVEELNFQMLQMQDQMRVMQEDNEFRLQQLEDGKQGSLVPSQGPETNVATIEPSVQTTVENAANEDLQDRLTTAAPPLVAGAELGNPPRSLGSVTLDGNGNVVNSAIDFSSQGIGSAIDGAAVASVTLTGSPDDIYGAGYRHVLDGDYVLAEAVFESFIETYPTDPLVADAKFWLGESIFAQGRFEDAADVFIGAHSRYPQADKAPETMLKIGVIMADLGNRDVACATFNDALASYGDMALKTREAINNETAKARC